MNYQIITTALAPLTRVLLVCLGIISVTCSIGLAVPLMNGGVSRLSSNTTNDELNRTFTCQDELPEDMVVARGGPGGGRLVINRQSDPGECSFSLEHIAPGGARTTLSSSPGGYLLAALLVLNDGVKVACATRMSTSSTGAFGERRIDRADLQCAFEDETGWGLMAPLVTGGANRAIWLDDISQHANGDSFYISYVADSTFNFLNMVNRDRPLVDGRYKIEVSLSSGDFATGIGSKLGHVAKVPKPEGVLGNWDPTQEEIDALIAQGWFKAEDFEAGECPLPEGCSPEGRLSRPGGSNRSSSGSLGPNGSSSGGSSGGLSAGLICEDGEECIDSGVGGSFTFGEKYESPEIEVSCGLIDGDLKGSFEVELKGEVTMEACPVCAGSVEVGLDGKASGSICGKYDLEANFDGTLKKKKQHCLDCVDENHKICAPEYCTEDTVDGHADLEISQEFGFKAKKLSAGPVSARFTCAATLTGKLTGDMDGSDYSIEGCTACKQCTEQNATVEATLEANISCGVKVKVKRLGSLDLGCSNCGNANLTVTVSNEDAKGPDCEEEKTCRSAKAEVGASAETGCHTIGVGWFSVGFECGIGGEASIEVNTCEETPPQVSWDAWCQRC